MKPVLMKDGKEFRIRRKDFWNFDVINDCGSVVKKMHLIKYLRIEIDFWIYRTMFKIKFNLGKRCLKGMVPMCPHCMEEIPLVLKTEVTIKH